MVVNPALVHPVLSAPARFHLSDGGVVESRGIWSRRPSEEGGVEAPTSLVLHASPPDGEVSQVSDPATSVLYSVLVHDEAHTAIGSQVGWRSTLYHLRDEGRVYAPDRALYTAAVEDPHVEAGEFLSDTGRSFLASPVRWARFARAKYAALAFPRALGALVEVRVPDDPFNQVSVFQSEDDVELWGVACRVYATRWEVYASALGGGRAEVVVR